MLIFFVKVGKGQMEANIGKQSAYICRANWSWFKRQMEEPFEVTFVCCWLIFCFIILLLVDRVLIVLNFFSYCFNFFYTRSGKDQCTKRDSSTTSDVEFEAFLFPIESPSIKNIVKKVEEVEAEDDEEDMVSLLHCTQVRFRICFIFQVSYHCISYVKDAAILLYFLSRIAFFIF